MKTADIEIISKAIDLQKVAVTDSCSAVNTVEDESISEALISVLNDEIAVMQRLRKLYAGINQKRTMIPVPKEEIRAVVNAYS